MQRSAILLIITVFATGHALAWRCEHPCGPVRPAVVLADCHAPAPVAAARIVDDHDCGDHLRPAELAAKGTRHEARGVVWANLSGTGAGPDRVAHDLADVRSPDVRPPEFRLFLPLRI